MLLPHCRSRPSKSKPTPLLRSSGLIPLSLVGTLLLAGVGGSLLVVGVVEAGVINVIPGEIEEYGFGGDGVDLGGVLDNVFELDALDGPLAEPLDEGEVLAELGLGGVVAEALVDVAEGVVALHLPREEGLEEGDVGGGDLEVLRGAGGRGLGGRGDGLGRGLDEGVGVVEEREGVGVAASEGVGAGNGECSG